MENSPHKLMPILNRSVILGWFSPQDDATVKCWGWNNYGELGLGDMVDRGQGTTCGNGGLGVCSPRVEMGTNLPSVDLGDERTAVAVSAGRIHTCALLVMFHRGKCPVKPEMQPSTTPLNSPDSHQ